MVWSYIPYAAIISETSKDLKMVLVSTKASALTHPAMMSKLGCSGLGFYSIGLIALCCAWSSPYDGAGMGLGLFCVCACQRACVRAGRRAGGRAGGWVGGCLCVCVCVCVCVCACVGLWVYKVWSKVWASLERVAAKCHLICVWRSDFSIGLLHMLEKQGFVYPETPM